MVVGFPESQELWIINSQYFFSFLFNHSLTEKQTLLQICNKGKLKDIRGKKEKKKIQGYHRKV